VVLAVLSAALTLTSFAASAQEDRSIADLREDIEGMNITSGEKYYQIADMRSKTMLMLYTMERVNVSADVKQFIFSVENFLDTFESTYKKSETGDFSVHRESINKGRDMKQMASDLKAYKNDPELKEYEYVSMIVDNADDAVKRFLDDEGAYFEEMAKYENVTPITIWHLKDAITAYEESTNNEKRDEVDDKYKTLNSEFNRNMATVRVDKREADALLNKSDALKDSENVLDLVSAFLSSTEAGMKYGGIEKIYIGYNLNSTGCSENIKCLHEYYEPFNEIINKKKQASDISDSLVGTILLYVLGIAVVLLGILFYFQKSYSSYKEETTDTKLGRELGLDKTR